MANPASLRMLEYPTGEALEFQNLESGPLVRRRSQWRREPEAHGILTNSESTWHTRSGRAIQVSETTRVVRHPDGNTAYYEGWAQDISLHKAAQVEREEARLFNTKLIETIPDVIYIFDLGKECSVFANRSYFKVIGQDPEVVRQSGNPVAELVP